MVVIGYLGEKRNSAPRSPRMGLYGSSEGSGEAGRREQVYARDDRLVVCMAAGYEGLLRVWIYAL